MSNTHTIQGHRPPPTEDLSCASVPSLHSGNVSPRLKIGIIALFVGLAAAKTVAAMHFNLFGDEAFYFQCAQRLDICYVDHPFMTALLVRLGTWLAGNTTLGVRLLFLAIGLGIPLGVFWLARPLVGSRDAWLAMAASLLIPPFGLLSALAVPDVPLVALVALGLAAFERATRRGGNLRWFFAGLIAALGLCTQYRFAPFAFASLLYLAGTAQGRSCLKKPGPWICMAVMCSGLLPALLYNMRLSWAPFWFQFVDRHNGGFHPAEMLVYILEQMAIVSPLLYVGMLFVLVTVWQRARRGDSRSTLLAIFASTFLGCYLFLSPWYDAANDHVHWPLPGYLPLLVLLPATLRSFLHSKPTWLRKTAVLMAPGLAGVVTLLVLIELSSGLLKIGFLHNAFTGWSQCGRQAQAYLRDSAGSSDSPPIVAGDNYMLAGQLEFYMPEAVEVYTFDHHRNKKHGRGSQYMLWHAGEQGLRGHLGQNALVVVEDTATGEKKRQRWLAHIGSFFGSLEYLGELDVPMLDSKNRTFLFYRGRCIIPQTKGAPQAPLSAFTNEKSAVGPG